MLLQVPSLSLSTHLSFSSFAGHALPGLWPFLSTGTCAAPFWPRNTSAYLHGFFRQHRAVSFPVYVSCVIRVVGSCSSSSAPGKLTHASLWNSTCLVGKYCLFGRGEKLKGLLEWLVPVVDVLEIGCLFASQRVSNKQKQLHAFLGPALAEQSARMT